MGKEAGVDGIFKGRGYGSVASRLLANDMNASALRTNDTLRYDEWKQLDEAVMQISRQRMVGAGDLISAGLSFNLGDGLGTTVLQTENVGDMEAAQMDMAADTEGKYDRVEFAIGYLPLPIIHKEYTLNLRVLRASRKMGESLDTTMASVAARKISEKVETILFCGASSYAFGGGTLYGYTDFPQRNTISLGTHWNDSPSTGSTIISKVLEMKQSSIDARHFGPWMLYVPTAYDTALDDDFKAESDKTTRQRIRDIEGIKDVKVADFLTANNVVLVEMAPETIRLIIGLQPTNVEWETKGGMISHFKVMTIMVPQIRADQDGNCGIVHAS